jgi:two-component system NtrC family sensor kinase
MDATVGALEQWQRPSPAHARERLSSMALLVAGAAHDIASPLTYLLANLEYLDGQLAGHREELPPGRADELRQCLREAVLGAKRVRDIVRDLPAGAPRQAEEPVDLHRILISCIRVARTEIDHRARVITELDAVPPLPCSESRLSSLFLNLITNAAQAVSGDSEKEHFIRVVARTDTEDRVVVEVIDSGPGIPQEHLDRIFEPFFTTKPASQGTGLGLALCRHIAEELGGTITVSSTLGRGAAFRVTLPAPRAPRPSEAPPRDPRAGHLAPSKPPVRRLPLRQL